MSKESVDRIVQRAVEDDAYFELLRSNPEQATAGFDLDDGERRAFALGAYNVAVRSARREREERVHQQPQPIAAATAPSAVAVAGTASSAVSAGRPSSTGLGLVIGLIVVILIGGGMGSFRYFEQQWPWQALGLGKAPAPAALPKPSLGARPQPTTQPARPSAAASARPSSSASASGQAQLRSTPSASALASPSSTTPADTDAQKAYYQRVGQRLQAVVKSYAEVLAALRANADASQPLASFSTALKDLQQQVPGSTAPSNLSAAHQTMVQALPLLQADADQLKAALDQKNQVQAVLVATEMEALFNQFQDEVAFANAAHPDFYQAIDTKQLLPHVAQFDVVGQNVTQRAPGPASVTLRIALRSANPTNDEIADTLHHGVVVARQSFPQATHVQVVGFKELNNEVGPQLGTADWYCGPDSLPSDAGASAKWQDYCGQVYIATGTNGKPTAVPY